jgi:Matrixin
MARKLTRMRPKTDRKDKAFERKPNSTKGAESEVHVFGDKVVCDTEPRGHATPRGRSPLEIVVDASEGFIPLWAKNTTLRWRFRESSMRQFRNPTAAKAAIRRLFGEALLEWGDAAPVKFAERNDAWDFEIVMRRSDDCDANGCVLASAFFPDAGRHQLLLYPKMFTDSHSEQVETLVHEIGHVFGLRHFFANISETEFPSEIFGVHRAFSIMNYGNKSRLTPDDKADLKRLYQLAWSGQLTQINGTPIRFVRPFHTIGAPPQGLVAVAPPQLPQPQPLPRAAYTEIIAS